ncbi:hypothetical protein [Paenibacillus sp. SI8]|uniref:hypothetical protein n=1 Tax=unclassified Paenibacillus TaxID=185978 RepID=UPI0034676135
MLFFQLILYGIVCWFGLYMCNRDTRNVKLWFSGLSLVICACGLGAWLLVPFAQEAHQSEVVGKVRDLSLLLPLALWQGVIVSYSSSFDSKRSAAWNIWKYVFLSLFLISGILLMIISNEGLYTIACKIIYCATLALCVLFTVGSALATRSQASQKRSLLMFIPLIVHVFTVVFVLFLRDDSWKGWSQVGSGIGLLLFAVHVMVTEIKAQGESWLPDFFRSLDYSVFFTFLFSGQVALAIGWAAGFNFTSLILLQISIAISIAFQVFVYPIRAMLDHIAFITFPKLRHEQTRLRLVESVQVRIDEAAVPDEINEEDLFRYTRRALSNFGDLERLASNPLTQMKWIHHRLQKRGVADEVLERAVELKSVLLESIGQLKPRSDDEFGTTEEWRLYNALYFPYIVGVKPYSLRYSDEHLDNVSRDALEWFRTNVPERTCYNWQNAAARLVALNLKEKNAS